MAELTPNWKHFARIWWTFTWRQIVITFMVGFILAAAVSVFGVAAGFSFRSLDRFMSILFIVVGLFASIVALRSLLSTEWKGFRIVLVPIENVDGTDGSEVTRSPG